MRQICNGATLVITCGNYKVLLLLQNTLPSIFKKHHYFQAITLLYTVIHYHTLSYRLSYTIVHYHTLSHTMVYYCTLLTNAVKLSTSLSNEHFCIILEPLLVVSNYQLYCILLHTSVQQCAIVYKCTLVYTIAQ